MKEKEAMSDNDKGKQWTYAEAGVNIEEGDRAVDLIKHHVQRTFGPNVVQNYGGFAGIYSLGNSSGLFAKQYKEPVLLGCCDGVGTKVKVAFLMDKHDTVGIDLVAMSVNDLVVQGSEPLFFLDYIAASKLEPEKISEIVKGIADGCCDSGCALIGGETAEMPGLYRNNEYDLAGFAVGIAEKKKLIDGRYVESGDVVIGIASSGLHSNGYSLAIKVLLEVAKLPVDEFISELGCTVGEALLEPTNIYVRGIRALMKYYKVKGIIKSVAHITGGGLVGNVPRVIPPKTSVRLQKDKWPLPPIFKLIQDAGNISEEEMYRVFNMGIGMTVICPAYNAAKVCQILEREKYEAYVIGKVVKGKGEVIIE